MVNKSQHTCHMRGFVGARFLDRHNHPMRTHVTRDHSTPARRVIVRHGEAAAFELRWSNVSTTNGPCRTARWLRITPPHSTSSFRVHFGHAPCRGELEIRAITDPSSV